MLGIKDMEFRTHVDLPLKQMEIHHSDRLMLFGSCFSENIGELLADNKFRIDINPFGVLYNPLSVSEAMNELLDRKNYHVNDLFYEYGLWHSWMHHSSFSSIDQSTCLEQINSRLKQAATLIREADVLICTFGSAWVYEKNGKVVGNCHKMPEALFIRRLLNVDEIVKTLSTTLMRLRKQNSKIRILLTVSPIRHRKDGLHGNQISKSTLLLAIHKLQKVVSDCYYFPSYEIMMDELRDYRFYSDDMLHPSSLAIDYIWECFRQCYFSPSTVQIINEWADITKQLKHKPFIPSSESYREFLNGIVLNLNQLKRKLPYIDIKKELEQCQTQLKTFQK